MQCNHPIGFFDSGLGGISVLREAVRLLPCEDFIYYGDDANAPYGTRTESEINRLAINSTDFLARRRVKAIVVACNTATSVSIRTMRERYNVPVVSIEPAVKPAAEAYPEGTIAVLATPATLRQQRFWALVDRLGAADRVRGIACPDLAGLIEFGSLSSPELRGYIRNRLSELTGEKAVNGIVLGCTHYTFAGQIIQSEAMRLLRGACRLFDGAAGTARQLRRVLEERDILNRTCREGRIEFFSSAGGKVEERMQIFFRYGGNEHALGFERRQDA